MPLHRRETAEAELEEDLYASIGSDTSALKYWLREQELRGDEAAALVHDELFLAGNTKQNLIIFRSTWLEPEVHPLMHPSIDTDEHPVTAECKNRCVCILADPWHSPKTANAQRR